MVTRMILITILILAILFATWVKDREPSTSDIAKTVINVALLYFVGQFIYLIAKISPMFDGLVKLIKKNGVSIPETGEEQMEDKKE